MFQLSMWAAEACGTEIPITASFVADQDFLFDDFENEYLINCTKLQLLFSFLINYKESFQKKN